MRLRIITFVAMTLCGESGLVDQLGTDRVRAADLLASDTTADIEVLARGPIHEAFAEPVVFDPTPGITISKRPPDAVEEIPPDQKPEGVNVVWIPGYWGWDDEVDDLIWISGFWRVVPPGRQWVPGYWTEVPGGFQWVSGFWGADNTGPVDYLPAPPPSLEVGPSTYAPSDDYFWAPGNWQWYQNRYVWRAGCWTIASPNWTWVPPYYSWTPRGFVCVNGYWDYALSRRGLLYAPVCFRPGVSTRIGFSFSPSFVVDLTVLTNHLFVRPQCHHYYYGDYHATRYLQSGVYPCFTFHSSHRGYDPIYAHQHHHHDRDWDNRLRAGYREHQQHAANRPPRIFDAKTNVGGHDHRDGRSLVKSFDQWKSSPDAGLRLEKISAARRADLTKLAHETRQYTKNRGELESHTGKDRDNRPPHGDGKSRQLQLPKSPIVEREHSHRDDAKSTPPTSIQSHKLDLDRVLKSRSDWSRNIAPKKDPQLTNKSADKSGQAEPKTTTNHAPLTDRLARPNQEPKKTPTLPTLRSPEIERQGKRTSETKSEPFGNARFGRQELSDRNLGSTPPVVPRAFTPRIEHQDKPRPERKSDSTGAATRFGQPLPSVQPRSTPTPSPRLERHENPRLESKPNLGVTPRMGHQAPPSREPRAIPAPGPNVMRHETRRPESRPEPAGASRVGHQAPLAREPRSAPAPTPRFERPERPKPEPRMGITSAPRIERHETPKPDVRPAPPQPRKTEPDPGPSVKHRGKKD